MVWIYLAHSSERGNKPSSSRKLTEFLYQLKNLDF
jgi:hypothetical protein